MAYKSVNFSKLLPFPPFFMQVLVKKSLILWFGSMSLVANAQIDPIQVTTQLIPPYSVYLPDYVSAGSEKLRVILLQRDLSQPSYQLRLNVTIELNGSVILQTSPFFNPPPINVRPGVPTAISGADLQHYLDSRNLEFTGYSRDQYEKTKALPEGSYQICFTAYDYTRQNVRVSSPGCSFYWLSKNEPPLVNFPACGSNIAAITPQQIIFSWLPRNTGSPNSAAETEYELSLFEIRSQDRDPNDIVLSTEPVFKTVTSSTQFAYGVSEPVLYDNMKYAWRVRAIDKQGRDQFRNDGFSEVCTFTYGNPDAIDIATIEGLQAQGETESRGRVNWNALEGHSYRLYYKRQGSDYEWFTIDTEKNEEKLFDLDPETDYEVRVQGKINESFGPYSDIVQFTTMAARRYECGENLPEVPEDTKPVEFVTRGMIINVQDLELTLAEVSNDGEDGWYKGKGEVSIPYLGGASFRAKFDRIFIDENRNATKGRIDILTRDVGEWIEEEIEKQEQEALEEQQEENREKWAGTDFYEDLILYDDIVIDSMYVNSDGNVILVDPSGQTYINTDIPVILADAPEKAIIVEDKEGDQWVVQAGGKVTKVPGGGLSPNQVEVTEEALNIIKQALTELGEQYNTDELERLRVDLEEKRAVLDDYIHQHNSQIIAGIAEESADTEQDLGEEDMGSLFFDFVEVEYSGEVEETEFDRLSISTKSAELEYNRGQIINFLAKPEHMDKSPDMVAMELKVNSTPVSEYITNAGTGGATGQEILSTVKEAIVLLIDEILTADDQVAGE